MTPDTESDEVESYIKSVDRVFDYHTARHHRTASTHVGAIAGVTMVLCGIMAAQTWGELDGLRTDRDAKILEFGKAARESCIRNALQAILADSAAGLTPQFVAATPREPVTLTIQPDIFENCASPALPVETYNAAEARKQRVLNIQGGASLTLLALGLLFGYAARRYGIKMDRIRTEHFNGEEPKMPKLRLP